MRGSSVSDPRWYINPCISKSLSRLIQWSREYLFRTLGARGPFTDPDYQSPEDTIERLTTAKVLSVMSIQKGEEQGADGW